MSVQNVTVFFMMLFRQAVVIGFVMDVLKSFLARSKFEIIIYIYYYNNNFKLFLRSEGTVFCPRPDCDEELTNEDGRPVRLLFKYRFNSNFISPSI